MLDKLIAICYYIEAVRKTAGRDKLKQRELKKAKKGLTKFELCDSMNKLRCGGRLYLVN